MADEIFTVHMHTDMNAAVAYVTARDRNDAIQQGVSMYVQEFRLKSPRAVVVKSVRRGWPKRVYKFLIPGVSTIERLRL